MGTDEKRELVGEGEYAHAEDERKIANINAALENPLTGLSHERLEGASLSSAVCSNILSAQSDSFD